MAVMLLYARFRDLHMQSRIVMTVHGAVYVEAPEEEWRCMLRNSNIKAFSAT